MVLTKQFKLIEKLLADNSPVILTGIAVAGTAATAYLTGKASFKAYERIEAERDRRVRETPEGHPFMFNRTDKAKLVWKEYIPAAGAVVLTITCVICANRISTRRAAALAVAYSLSEKKYSEYKEKVLEKFGENKERAVREEIAHDRVNQQPLQGVLVATDGDVLCMDSYSGRYFRSTMEDLKKAQNDTNYEILHIGFSSLGDFYNRIGLSGTKFSEELGWNSDHQLEIDFSTVLTDDQKPCLVIDYSVAPTRGFKQHDYLERSV